VRHVGIVVAERAAAIVQVNRDAADAMLCTDIERLASDLGALSARARELENPDTLVTVDGEGLGSALWAVLGRPEDASRWRLYAGHGLERQALVDELLVAIQEDRFHFAPALPEQAAMSKAMLGYRRAVKEDGLIGGELVVALLLALIPPPPPPVKPFVIVRNHLWGAAE
jgi:hypothetical protein